MTRSHIKWRIAALLLSATACAALPVVDAHAQTRTFPEKSAVGRMTVGVFPEGTIEGKPVRFAPGARILNEANLLVVPSTFPANTVVRYRVDSLGLIDAVWILSGDEIAAARARQ